MMSTARTLLALLPLAALVLAAHLLRPRDGQPAPGRLAIIRAAIALSAATTVGVELLSLVGGIATLPVTACWLTATAALGWLVWRRRPRFATAVPKKLTTVEWAVVGGLGVLAAAELVLALASAPNNFDSNSYHLPKIEHWIADGDVNVYPTIQIQQIVLVPGAEYLLLQLRLLTGGDGTFNLLQYGAALLGAAAVSRCAAQLGAGRLGQLVAAAVFLTAPAVVLESTSTQNDLVVTAWVACAATLALDGVRRLATAGEVAALAAVAGLIAVTKSTGLMALAPILVLWGVGQLRQRRLLRTAAAGAAVLAGMLVLAGPSLLRVQQAFGSPLGPPGYSTGLSNQRHDPPAVLVNALRLGASTLLTPVPAVNVAVGAAVVDMAHLVGVDPNDPDITQWRSVFPGDRWKPDEDRSPYPVQAALVLAALAATLLLWRRVPPGVRGYAVTVLAAFLVTAAVIKWQYWGNRLILPAFVLGVPLTGVWADRLRGSRLAAGAMALVLAAGFVTAYGAVALGQPRRLLGQGSVFTMDEWQQRFARSPAQAGPYRSAIDDLRASGVRRVGLVMDGDLWEYPIQISLPDVELVALESEVPTAPPPPVSSVEAIMCVSTDWRCAGIVPPTWRLQRFDAAIAVAYPE